MTTVPKQDLINGVAYDVQVNTLADRDAYDNEAEGFAVLVSNVGDGRSAVYSRIGEAGNWSDPAYITGPAGEAGPFTNIIFGPVTTVPSNVPASSEVVQIDPDTIRVDLSIPKGADGTGTGDVVGPASSADGDLVAFDGATGKLVKKATVVPDNQMPSRVGVIASVITNWNNALDNGWYMANSATNAPATGWFIGLVEARGDSGGGSQYRTQTVHNFVDAVAGNTVAYRRHQKGTWGAWYKLQISQAEQDARYLQLAAQTLSDAQKAQARLNIDATGNLHKITIYSANHLPSGTHTYATGTKKARVRVKGAGAGSGSVTGAPSNAQATNTGGGGEGGEAIKFFELGSITSATIVVGAAGAADANGGNSSYSDGVSTLTGNGGQASAGQPAAASGFRVSAGGNGGTASGGDINIRGQAGDYGFSAGTSVVTGQTSATGGKGGGTSGGAAPVLGTSATAGQSAGNNATGYGCGASGAVSVGGGTTVSGGTGSGGIVIIEEYK